jgi:hypothetical protein
LRTDHASNCGSGAPLAIDTLTHPRSSRRRPRGTRSAGRAATEAAGSRERR